MFGPGYLILLLGLTLGVTLDSMLGVKISVGVIAVLTTVGMAVGCFDRCLRPERRKKNYQDVYEENRCHDCSQYHAHERVSFMV